MFAANDRVSKRQLRRIFITENIAMALLLSCTLAGELPSLKFLWLLVAGMALSISYIYIMERLCKKIYGAEGGKDNRKSAGIKILRWFIGIRSAVMAVFGVYVYYKVVSAVLLQDMFAGFIYAGIIALCIYVSAIDFEERGRMHEILWVFVAALIIIVLVTATAAADWAGAAAAVKDFFTDGKAIEGLKGIKGFKDIFGWPGAKGWLLFAVLFFSTNYYEALILIGDNVQFKEAEEKGKKDGRNTLLMTPVYIWLLTIWAYILSVYFFGGEAGLFKLMDIGGIPGGIFSKQQAIMAVFVIASLTSYVSGMIYYVKISIKGKSL